VNDAKVLIKEVETLSKEKVKLEEIDKSLLDTLSNENVKIKSDISDLNAEIKSNILKLDELSVPLPDDDLCKHCRQKMTKEHKDECKKTIKKDIDFCQKAINAAKISVNN